MGKARRGGADGADAGAQPPRIELLRDGDSDSPDAWMLTVDGTPQSHVDLADPERLDFEYVRRLGHLADLAAAPGAPIDVLHLGAGGLTLARYIAATRPGSRQRAVDIDAELVELVRERLPLGRRSGVRVGIGDAREWLAQRQDGSADLVVSDAFAGARTPARLTTAEFFADAARVLRPGGVFAANVADGGRLGHARAQAATASAVFGHAALVAEPSVLRGRRFGNLVLAASAAPLPEADLARRAHRDPDMARVLSGPDLAAFTASASAVRDAGAADSPAPPDGAFLS
ncbi:spermidine synthase [Nocardiopsis coralliicola]